MLTIHSDAPSIRLAEGGRTVRIANTRIPLELVIYAYNQGETPEEIAEDFDVLTLADVYATIAYYLRHKQEVDEYIAEADAKADEIQRKIETDLGTKNLLIKHS